MTSKIIIPTVFLSIALAGGAAAAEDIGPEAINETFQPEPELTLDSCRDGSDNDGDGHIDCADQGCEIFAICLEDTRQDTTAEATVIDDTTKNGGQLSVAGSVAPTRPVHEHSGAFFRGTIGIGAGGYHTSGSTDNLDLESGTATHLDEFNSTTGLSLSVGGSLAENLILHADFTKLGVSDDDDDPAHPGLDLYGLGIGITRYWMPINIYLTGSIGPAMALLQDGRHNYDNVAFGVIGKAAVGKEWWASENWGLGIAVEATYSYTTLNAVHFQEGSCVALFSVTYN